MENGPMRTTIPGVMPTKRNITKGGAALFCTSPLFL